MWCACVWWFRRVLVRYHVCWCLVLVGWFRYVMMLVIWSRYVLVLVPWLSYEVVVVNCLWWVSLSLARSTYDVAFARYHTLEELTRTRKVFNTIVYLLVCATHTGENLSQTAFSLKTPPISSTWHSPRASWQKLEGGNQSVFILRAAATQFGLV